MSMTNCRAIPTRDVLLKAKNKLIRTTYAARIGRSTLNSSAYKHGAEEGCTEWRDDHETGVADRDVRDGEIQRHR